MKTSVAFLKALLAISFLGLGVGTFQSCNSESTTSHKPHSEKRVKKNAKKAYFNILDILSKEGRILSESGRMGQVPCEVKMKVSRKEPVITVTYAAMGSVAKEKGTVSDLKIADVCGMQDRESYFPVSIKGRWQPTGTGGGDLVISFSKTNEVHLNIFGDGNFRYGRVWAVDSLDNLFKEMGYSPGEDLSPQKNELYEAENKQFHLYLVLDPTVNRFEVWDMPKLNGNSVRDSSDPSFSNGYYSIGEGGKTYYAEKGSVSGTLGSSGKYAFKKNGSIILKNSSGDRFRFKRIGEEDLLDEKLTRHLDSEDEWILGGWQTEQLGGDPVYTFSSSGRVVGPEESGYYSFFQGDLRIWWGKGSCTAYQYKPGEYFSNYTVSNHGSYYATGGATFYQIHHYDPDLVLKNKDSALPEQYSWLVTGGEWMDNPWGYVGPTYSFNSNKTYQLKEYDESVQETIHSGYYAVIQDSVLFLRENSGRFTVLELDSENESIFNGGNRLFALAGTKFDEMMRNTFDPGPQDYFHEDWLKNGILLSFIWTENQLDSAIFFQYSPLDDPHEQIETRPLIRKKTLAIKNGNQFIDEEGRIVATGVQGWPYMNILTISGDSEEWFFGLYVSQ